MPCVYISEQKVNEGVVYHPAVTKSSGLICCCCNELIRAKGASGLWRSPYYDSGVCHGGSCEIHSDIHLHQLTSQRVLLLLRAVDDAARK